MTTTPADLYRGCRYSAHRVETLQRYAGLDDEARQRAFYAGEPLPPPGPHKQETIEVYTALRQAGRQLGRVHIVDLPLTPYMHYELLVYEENVAAGEEVAIVERTADPGLADMTRDFTIFDGGTPDAVVVWFNYDQDGRVHGYEVTDDPAVTDWCWRAYQLARAHAVPLDEFTATKAVTSAGTEAATEAGA